VTTAAPTGANETSGANVTTAAPTRANETSEAMEPGRAWGDLRSGAESMRLWEVTTSGNGTTVTATAPTGANETYEGMLGGMYNVPGCKARHSPCPKDPKGKGGCCSGYCTYTNGWSGGEAHCV
jgi:hypothetical protein